MTELELVAIAICRSRTCEGINCCQWPANGGRLLCPVKAGGYEDAARDAIAALDNFRAAEKRKNCKHTNKRGSGSIGSDGSSKTYWYCMECGTSYNEETPARAAQPPAIPFNAVGASKE